MTKFPFTLAAYLIAPNDTVVVNEEEAPVRILATDRKHPRYPIVGLSVGSDGNEILGWYEKNDPTLFIVPLDKYKMEYNEAIQKYMILQRRAKSGYIALGVMFEKADAQRIVDLLNS